MESDIIFDIFGILKMLTACWTLDPLWIAEILWEIQEAHQHMFQILFLDISTCRNPRCFEIVEWAVSNIRGGLDFVGKCGGTNKHIIV